MTILTETFGEKLNTLRSRLELTTLQLATRASVPQSLISGLQAGSRRIGEDNARKIGMALELSDWELEEFVYLAINDSAEKVLDEYKGYPAEVLNLVAAELQQSGIQAQDVGRCVLHPKLRNGDSPDAAVYLRDGRSVIIEVKVRQQ
jgi:transcriptional regulator with XRE-family HTH domain